jgi:hypothetical protein
MRNLRENVGYPGSLWRMWHPHRDTDSAACPDRGYPEHSAGPDTRRLSYGTAIRSEADFAARSAPVTNNG